MDNNVKVGSVQPTKAGPQSKSAHVPRDGAVLKSEDKRFTWGDLSTAQGTTPAVACDSKALGQDDALILRWYAGLTDELASCPDGTVYQSPAFPPSADVNGDGKLGGQDAALILQSYAGLISCFPADTNCDGVGPEKETGEGEGEGEIDCENEIPVENPVQVPDDAYVNSRPLEFADPKLLIDKDYVISVLKLDGMALEFLNDDLRNDPDVVSAAIKQNSFSFQFASDGLKNNREFVLKAVKEDGGALSGAADAFKKDREIVSAAVKNSECGLYYADGVFKKDRVIVLEAVKNFGYQLQFADKKFRSDPQIVLEAVKTWGQALQYADPIFLNDPDTVLEAVKNDGNALQFAGDDIKKDKTIVFEAVKNNGLALEFADDTLKNDPDIVAAAVNNNGLALQFANSRFQLDRPTVLSAISQNGAAIEFAQTFGDDYDLVFEAVSNNGCALEFACPDFQNDDNIVLTAIKNDYSNMYSSFRYANDRLKRNKTFVSEVAKIDGRILDFADESFKKDRQIVMGAASNNKYANVLWFCDSSFKKDKDLVIAAVRQRGDNIEAADESLKNDKDVVLAAVDNNWNSLRFASSDLRKDRSFQRGLFDANYNCLWYMIDPCSRIIDEYDKIVENLDNINIEWITRFNTLTAEAIIQNRANLSQVSGSPVALLVFPKKDHNGAFLYNESVPTPAQLLERNYRVVFYEAGSENDLYYAMAETGEHNEISFLQIAGHGSYQSLDLGNFDSKFFPSIENRFLDLSDEQEMKNLGLNNYLSSSCPILLESCSNGKGGKGAGNLADMMKRVFPNHPVFAALRDTPSCKLVFDENNGVIGTDLDDYAIFKKARQKALAVSCK